MINAVDLCCGAGGWACAARGLPINWIAVADIALDCLETWSINHQEDHPTCEPVLCDLSGEEGRLAVLDAVGSRAVHLVVGGIPCEQVSAARGGVTTPADEMASWHALIDACLGLVRAFGPRWWCFEDVINVERHLPPPILTGMDYKVRRIQAETFGPQRRLRSFIGMFPQPALTEPGPRTVGEVLRPGPYRTVPDSGRYQRREANRGQSSLRLGNHSVRVIPAGGPSPCVISSVDRGSRQRRAWMVAHGETLRMVSWQERALIQGFPEDYLFAATQVATDKMIGRAIPIQVGRAILKAIVAKEGLR